MDQSKKVHIYIYIELFILSTTSYHNSMVYKTPTTSKQIKIKTPT
jgi:hypothetical protein